MLFLASMVVEESLGDLLDHIERSTGLGRAKAAQVVAEVLAYFSEPVDVFLRRRHRELRADRMKNEAVFARLLEEARARRFAAPALTERQVRRAIYG